jgi:hypothetical protein
MEKYPEDIELIIILYVLCKNFATFAVTEFKIN